MAISVFDYVMSSDWVTTGVSSLTVWLVVQLWTVLVVASHLLGVTNGLPITNVQKRWRDLALDTCDFTLWDRVDEPRGVRHVVTACAEGIIDWKGPYGALRLTLQGNTDEDIEVCFLASATSTIAKISLEENDIDSQYDIKDSLQFLTMLNGTNTTMHSTETCLRSGGPMTLYIESQGDITTPAFGKIEIQYDVQKVRRKSDGDEMTECRPCTEKELITVVCSSDYVARGSIKEITHNRQTKETEVNIIATKIYRERSQLFQSQHNTGFGKNQQQFKGTVIAPGKCGIKQGEGQFLFLGRIRLGRALLQCAPRLEEFQRLWNKATAEGSAACVL